MVFRQGDAGDRVKELQRGLNKLGALLLVDGGFGNATREAVAEARALLNKPGPPDEADDDLQTAISVRPDPFPLLTRQ
jgi:peptidoglycan hydrolase-like protein with peptidoglycan-binding domain